MIQAFRRWRHVSGRKPAFIGGIASVVVLALVATGIWAAARRGGGSSRAHEQPNIVVLMTDDQTVESMRVLPKVQRLIGRQGVTFDNSFVSYSLCCPSRATYLTGQYAHNHGVLSNGPPSGGFKAFKNQRTTFPVALQEAGYHTVHIGKYLNGYGHPATQVPPGWDDWHGSVDPSTYLYFGYTLNENGKLRTFGEEESDYQTDVYGRMAADIVRKQAGSKKPFFMNVAFLAPHVESGEALSTNQPANDAPDLPRVKGPRPAPRYAQRFADEGLPDDPSFNEQDVTDKPAISGAKPLLKPAQVAGVTASYRARLESLLSVDDAVERIVRALEDTDQLDDTVVVFTSDNGFMDGEHRVASGKVVLYEPSIRVPLMVRGPGVRRDASTDAMVANVDLAPTIMELAGARPLRTMDGRSLVTLLQKPGQSWQRDILLESGTSVPRYTGIRTSRYVYAEYKNGQKELYDLSDDPYELRSRQRDPNFEAVKNDLARRLAALRVCGGESCR